MKLSRQDRRGPLSDRRRHRGRSARCLAEWESVGRIEPFALGARRASDRLLIPESCMVGTRDRGAPRGASSASSANGTPESCSSPATPAIGKSSVVNELHTVGRARLAASSRRASSTSTSAISPTPPWPRPSRASSARSWPRARPSSAAGATPCSEALGPNAQLVVDLVPELELVIGRQPAGRGAAAATSPEPFPDGVLRRFLGVFARPGASARPLPRRLAMARRGDPRPAAQTWSLTRRAAPPAPDRCLSGQRGRPGHPLSETRCDSRATECRTLPWRTLAWRPTTLIVMRCAAIRVRPRRSCGGAREDGGNPFFVIEFLPRSPTRAAGFDHTTRAWSWDLVAVTRRGTPTTSFDLLVGKLDRLPVATQKALQTSPASAALPT